MSATSVDSKVLKPMWVGVVLLLGGTIWFLDFLTGPDLSFSIFYLIPICLAAWQLGFVAGLGIAVVSAVMWVMADYSAQHNGHSVVMYWNGLVRLELFVLTVMVIHNLQHLNHSLRNRTASLILEIAERRRAEEALAESQKIFRLITENASDLIAVLNLDGDLVYTSPSCQALLGRAEAWHGKEFLHHVLPEDRPQVREVFLHTVQTGISRRAEYRIASRGGSPVYLESEWSLVRQTEGEPRNVVVVSRDVTARKRMELLFANEKEILEMIAERKPLPEVLRKLVQKVETWSEEVCCSIRVFDADGKAILHEMSHNPQTGAREEHMPPLPDVNGTAMAPAGEGCTEAAAAGERRLVQDIAPRPGLEAAFDKPVLSALGEVLGHLTIYVRSQYQPEVARLQLFEKVAHVTAIALERQRSEDTLRRLSSLILNAQEAERRRLASELHDGVSQMLASVSFRVHSVIAQIPRENVPLRTEVAKARFLLRKVIHEVRSISENLRPSELDDLGLVAAVRSLCEDFQERNQLTVEFTTPPRPERFSNEVELALYRIVQEGLANIEKHAEAKRVHLALEWDERFVTLRLQDNGKGIPATTNGNGARKRHGMGLVDMRERCAFLGGTFTIRSEREAGTELAARIPRTASNGNCVTE